FNAGSLGQILPALSGTVEIPRGMVAFQAFRRRGKTRRVTAPELVGYYPRSLRDLSRNEADLSASTPPHPRSTAPAAPRRHPEMRTYCHPESGCLLHSHIH